MKSYFCRPTDWIPSFRKSVKQLEWPIDKHWVLVSTEVWLCTHATWLCPTSSVYLLIV